MITTLYKSRTGLLLKLLFAALMGCLLFFSISEGSWALLAVNLLIGVVVIYIFRHTHYSIHRHRLNIKSGFLFDETIDILHIQKIKIVRKHLLSGPGFSVHRLIIFYQHHNMVVISPDQREAFISHLKRINPDIIIEEGTGSEKNG